MAKMYRYFLGVIVVVVTSLSLFTACIKNDLPYPVVELSITSIQVEGIVGVPMIDEVNRVVNVELEEKTDIENVNITSVTYTDNAKPSIDIVGTHNLRAPLSVTLSLYQDYEWNIVASQNIERYFTVDGQIGSTEWNVEQREAVAYVGFEDLSNVQVTSLKLAAADISTYEWADGVSSTDFRTVRYVYVTTHGRTERWSLYVKTTDVVVDITAADAWAKVMWLYGRGVSDTDLGFRYRKKGDAEWIEASDVKVDGGAFSACVKGLETLTEYEVMAYSDDNTSAVYSVKTEEVAELENGGLNTWSTIKKIVCPYLDSSNAYWDTGNHGSAVVGATITDKSSDVRPGSIDGCSARLASTFASVAGIGKFAAGNLFIGKYIKTIGTNGIVGFGRKFNARPLALKLWLKYNCGEIDQIGSVPAGSTMKLGDPDTGSIYIALGDWTKEEYGVAGDGSIVGTDDYPLIVDTSDKKTFFNPSSPAVIAYGELFMQESVDEWQEIVIPLNYATTSRVPTHITIVCSASRYGDYFTGSTKSVLWVDDMELVYE